MTGRSGRGRATSVNPAARKVDAVPWESLDDETRAAAATSTGYPSNTRAPADRAHAAAPSSKARETPLGLGTAGGRRGSGQTRTTVP